MARSWLLLFGPIIALPVSLVDCAHRSREAASPLPVVRPFADAGVAKLRDVDLNFNGLSSLFWDARSSKLWAITDDTGDPGRGSASLPRLYRLRLKWRPPLGLEIINEATFPIQNKDGVPYAMGELDPEAMLPTPWGGWLVSSESIPGGRRRGLVVSNGSTEGAKLLLLDAQMRVTALGKLPKDFKAAPKGQPPRGLNPKNGWESLVPAECPGKKGFCFGAITEGPLFQEADQFPDRSRWTQFRLWPDGALETLRENFYEADPHPTPQVLGFRPSRFDRGVSDVLAVGDGSFLVMERGFYMDSESPGHKANVIRLFRARLPARPGAAVTKLLWANITELEPWLRRQSELYRKAETPIDNLEGLAFIPADPATGRPPLLLLMSDNNFNPSENTHILFLTHPKFPQNEFAPERGANR